MRIYAENNDGSAGEGGGVPAAGAGGDAFDEGLCPLPFARLEFFGVVGAFGFYAGFGFLILFVVLIEIVLLEIFLVLVVLIVLVFVVVEFLLFLFFHNNYAVLY